MIDLDEQQLFRTYAQAKQLRIESLLDQYGSSLADMRELYPKLTETIEKQRLVTTLPTQALFFIPSEAAEMGLSLEEGWMLKISPVEGGYKSSFITPSKWEMTEDELYISPAGEKYSRADLEALLAPPSGLEAGITGIPTLENLTEEGKAAYQEYQASGGTLGVAGWIDLRERQQVETEEIFGKVFPEQDISELYDYIQSNPGGFLADLKEIGWTTDTESLLKYLYPEITNEEMQDVFGVTAPFVSEGWFKDNILDPLTTGAVSFVHGLKMAFTSILPSVLTSLQEKLFISPAFEIALRTAAPEVEDRAKILDAIQLSAEQRFTRLMEQNNLWIDEHPELTPNPKYFESPFENTALFRDPGYYAYSFTNSLAYTLATMGTIVAVSAVASPFVGIPAGLLVAGGPEAGSMTEELVRQGVPFEEAAKWGSLYGLVAGGVETVSDLPFLGLVFKPVQKAVKPMWDTIFKGVSSRIAKGVIAGVLIPQAEALEEIITQVTHNAILQHYDSTQSLLEGVSQSYIQAVIASLPFGAIGGMASYRTFRNTLSPETGKQLDTLVDKLQTQGLTEEQAQVQAVNELARNPANEAELSKAIETAQNEYKEEHPEEIKKPELADKLLNEIKIAEQIKPTIAGVTLTPTQYEEGLYAINIEGREGSVGAVFAIPQGDALFVNRISMHEKGVLTRSLLRTIDEQLIAMAQAQGLKSIRIAAKPETIATYARAGYVREGDTNIMVKQVPTAEVPTTPAGMPEGTIPKDIQGVINKIRTLDKKQREFQTTADQIQSTSAQGQPPAVYGTTLDKAIKITEQKAELWNGIRGRVIKATGRTLWQTAIERNLPVVNYGEETYLDFFAEDIEALFQPKVPVTEAGMPEAGLQAGIPGMAAAEPIRPQPTGRLVQARMDDYLRLRDYNKQAVTDRISQIKKALEKKGRTELGLRGTLALELARLEAQQNLAGVEILEDIDFLINEVEKELGLRSMPYQGYGGKSHINLLRHPSMRAFKGYTTRQLEEMRNVYLQAREGMKAEVPVLEPTPIPETPPEVINRVKTDPTPASDEIILKKFIDCIKDAKPATEETQALRHKELQKRSAIFASILQGGEGYHAFEQAKSALKGPLPKADWDLDLQKFGITDAEITRMFDRIRLDDKLQPFQKLNTYEALTNLLSGATLTEGEINSLEKVFGSRLAVALIGKLPTGKRVVRILQDITNVPRTLVTIADLSATFRQGALLVFGQPVQFSEAFVAQLKAVFSEKNFRLIDEINHNNPYVASGKLKRLYIAPIGEAVTVEAREEAFRGRLIERVPLLGSIIRASERAYITFLNVLRVATTTYYCRQWEGTGKTQNDYDKLCDFINHATGRGDLGAFSQAGSWLSAIFFSPRFIMSRIQVPLDLINTTPAVRKVIARNLVAFVGTGMLALFLARLAGAETEDDPRSADFGKIKIGNTRIDFWGGYLPYVRLITQIITEERKSTKTGEVYKIIDPIDVGVNFFRSKLAPVPGFLWDLKSGSTFIGEELTAENAEKIIFEKLTPMFIQDLIEAVKDSGIAGVGYGLLSGLGIGIQTYSDNWESAELKLGLPVRSENFPYTIENEVYDVKDYYSEISQMLQIGTGVGATYEMLSQKKNIPALVLSVAQARDVLREIGFLPNKRLTIINADPTKGDTFEQYRVQWLAREKITNAEELAKFDKDYPDAYLGNITQAQYALLVEYHSLPETEKANFLGNHPELYINPREEWLRTHPEQNSLLALWGKADPYSTEAVNKVSALVKSLGIPENALVMKDLDRVTELKLKNQSLFDLIEAYGGLDDTLKGPDGLTARDRAIQQLYLDNPDFRDDERRIQALDVGTKDNPTLESMVEGWVERGQIADDFGPSSAEMKLWLIDNKEVHRWALENALLTDTGEGWNEDILRLQVNYAEDFDQYDNYGDITSPLYISNDDARADAREGMLFSKDKMTSFGVASYTINALEKNIPENLVTTYVDYYGIRKKEGVDYSAGWYEDDWYLLEHEDFYDTMLSLGLWQEKDFTKVPTRQVFSLYKTYMTLPTGQPRLDFRTQHLDLDGWLVKAKGYTPVGDR